MVQILITLLIVLIVFIIFCLCKNFKKENFDLLHDWRDVAPAEADNIIKQECGNGLFSRGTSTTTPRKYETKDWCFLGGSEPSSKAYGWGQLQGKPFQSLEYYQKKCDDTPGCKGFPWRPGTTPYWFYTDNKFSPQTSGWGWPEAGCKMNVTGQPYNEKCCHGFKVQSVIDSSESGLNKSKVSATKSGHYSHSNMGACENECAPERECLGVSFDVSTPGEFKECTTYTGASVNNPNLVAADSLCIRQEPSCNVDPYKPGGEVVNGKIWNDGNGKIIRPSNGDPYFRHTNEGACAAECNNNGECSAYLYDNQSGLKTSWKPCWLFRNANNNQTGLPLANTCTLKKSCISDPLWSSLVSKALYGGSCDKLTPQSSFSDFEKNGALDITSRFKHALDESQKMCAPITAVSCWPNAKCPSGNPNYKGNPTWWDNTDYGLGPEKCASQWQGVFVRGTNGEEKLFNWGSPIDITILTQPKKSSSSSSNSSSSNKAPSGAPTTGCYANIYNLTKNFPIPNLAVAETKLWQDYCTAIKDKNACDNANKGPAGPICTYGILPKSLSGYWSGGGQSNILINQAGVAFSAVWQGGFANGVVVGWGEVAWKIDGVIPLLSFLIFDKNGQCNQINFVNGVVWKRK